MSRITFPAFHNALRVMLNIDQDELIRAGVLRSRDWKGWNDFTADPYRWFVKADQETADRLWRLIEPRINGRPGR